MSRVGKKIIELPDGVEVVLKNNVLSVKGKLGQLTQEVPSFVKIENKNNTLQFSVIDESNKFQKSMWGTSRSLAANLVLGVSEGFEKVLELNGVGFKMSLKEGDLLLNIGFSHQVSIAIPDGITLRIENNRLIGNSIDKQLIGNFFTHVHNLKPADPYKHKGFKFPGRYYRKKVGKKAK